MELYSDPSHFILELIQNLDDAAYAQDVRAEVTFNLCGRKLTVESNQNGFTEADVRALCDMGESSKAPRSGFAKDMIGEKGIGSSLSWVINSGFRSVFAVADRVQVFSNGFNFEFDANKELGKICPIILEEEGPHHKTLFVLFLSLDDAGCGKLGHTLRSLRGEALLFLNRLCLLSVDVNGIVTSCSRYISTDEVIIESKWDGGTTTKNFVLVQSVWKPMPDHPKRPGKEAKICIAFPYDSAGPVLDSNFIYAFLPMQKMPFKVDAPVIY